MNQNFFEKGVVSAPKSIAEAVKSGFAIVGILAYTTSTKNQVNKSSFYTL